MISNPICKLDILNNLKNYDNNSTAIIEFKYEQEVDYLIRALNNTPFEHYILKVVKIEE